MLRVMTEQHGDRFTLSLHGRLAGVWVTEVSRLWESIVDTIPQASVVVCLGDVSFIDHDGEHLLERMYRRGTDIVASGCLNRSVVDALKHCVGRPASIAAGSPHATAAKTDGGGE